MPISFSKKNYLKKYPDVAAHSHWGNDPYGHFVAHGQWPEENRHPNPAYENQHLFNARNYLLAYPLVAEKWEGTAWGHYEQFGYAEGRDPNPPAPDPRIVDRVTGASFFSSCMLGSGRLLAGTYSEGSPIPSISMDGVKKLEVDCGESIFSMAPQGNTLYFSTENNGGFYRASLETWEYSKIHTLRGGKYKGAFDVRIIDDKVICVGGGEIYVVGIGTVYKFSDEFYVKSIYKLGGIYWVPGFRRTRDCAGHFVSTDLRTWAWRDGIPGARYMRGETSPGGSRAVLTGMLNFSGFQYHRDAACLFMHTADGVKPHCGFPGYDYTSVAKWKDPGTILTGLTRGWRSQEPGCQLVKVTHTTTMLGYFQEAELRDIEFDGDNYLAVTRTDKVGGTIYRVKDKVEPPDKFNGFKPTEAPVKVKVGHDNGVTTKGPDGSVWMFTGDGFVNDVKHETSVFRLAPGADPMVPKNWVFQKPFRGKCYGAKFVGPTLYLLISDKGSEDLGASNCRILSYTTGKRSGTLQSALDRKGINWFIINHPGDEFLIGCVRSPTGSFWAGTTPCPIWSGDPDNLGSFHKVTDSIGIRGIEQNRATTLSVTKVGSGWAAGLGDPISGVGHFASQDLYTGWELIYIDKLGMDTGHHRGPLSLNHFEVDGQWYRCFSGAGSVKNDNVSVQKVDRYSRVGGKAIGNYRGRESDGRPVFRFQKPGDQYPQGLRMIWQGGSMEISNPGVDRITHNRPDEFYWDHSSDTSHPDWHGKLVVMLPREFGKYYKNWEKGTIREDGCRLEW